MADQTVDYSTFKTLIAAKNLGWQYVSIGSYYDVFFIDGSITWHTIIYLSGFEPIGLDVSTNTANRNDFETNYKATANARSTSSDLPPPTTGTITANGQTVVARIVGANGCVLSLHGAYTGVSGFFEASDDDQTTWYPVLGAASDNSSSYASSVAGATNVSLLWSFNLGGLDHFRFRCTAYTSGIANIKITPVNYLEDRGSIVVGDIQHNAVDFGGSPPIKIGGVAKNTLITAAQAVADGDRVQAQYDKVGRMLVVPYGQRELVVTNNITLTATTTETTLLSSAGANVYLDMVSLVVSNSASSACTVKIRDATGGTIRMNIQVAANNTVVVPFEVPWTQATPNNNWTAQCGSSVSSVFVSALAIKNS